MSATVNVNGRITSEHEAVISVFDHGFLYGEGIYETMRICNQRPFLFDRHMRRLRNSARMIALEMDFTDADLAAQIRDTRAAADMKGAEAYIRVLVTRGVGELTYDPHATPTPSVVIIVKPQVDPPPEVRTRGERRHRGRRAESSGEREPDQEQQPAQLRARGATGDSARWLRRNHAELPWRAERMHDGESSLSAMASR